MLMQMYALNESPGIAISWLIASMYLQQTHACNVICTLHIIARPMSIKYDKFHKQGSPVSKQTPILNFSYQVWPYLTLCLLFCRSSSLIAYGDHKLWRQSIGHDLDSCTKRYNRKYQLEYHNLLVQQRHKIDKIFWQNGLKLAANLKLY